MSFEHPWTCPIIDKNINYAKSTIQEFLNDLLEDSVPILGELDRKHICDKQSAILYRDLENIFEDVRRSNEEMRQSAEKQIDSLESDISDLEYELEECESKIVDLNEEIDSLRSTIKEMEVHN